MKRNNDEFIHFQSHLRTPLKAGSNRFTIMVFNESTNSLKIASNYTVDQWQNVHVKCHQ